MAIIVKRKPLAGRANILIIPKETIYNFLIKHVRRISSSYDRFTVVVEFEPQTKMWRGVPKEKEVIAIILTTLKVNKLLTLPQSRVTRDLALRMFPVPAKLKFRLFDPIQKTFVGESSNGRLIVTIEKYYGYEKKLFLAALESRERLSPREREKIDYYFQKYPGNNLIIYLITHLHVKLEE